MIAAYVLIVVALNQSHSSPGTSSHHYSHPTVHMQEFQSEKACLFAGNIVLKRAAHMRNNLSVVCVPKGDVK